jgi:predicted transcriptional regulator of viral defense system
MSKLVKQINKIPKSYFSIIDLAKVLDLNRDALRVAISRAIKNEELFKLTKGWYGKDISKINLENLAVNIYNPSYISFQSALNYHNILSQQASSLTLATVKRKKEIKIADNLLIYHHIKPVLYWGFIRESDYLIAEAEKAFLDLAYLSLNGYANFDPSEMNLELLNKKKLKKYLNKFDNQRLNKLINNLLSCL